MLARRYLERLVRSGRVHEADRLLIARIAADGRVPADDLLPLMTLAELEDGPRPGEAILERIGRTDPAESETIKTLARLVADLPKDQRSALLPHLRALVRDRTRRGAARYAFAAFSAGDENDVQRLGREFARAWPPISFASTQGPITEAMRAERLQRDDEIEALLTGIRALGTNARELAPMLVAASKEWPPAPGRFNHDIWRTMADDGVDIAALGRRRGYSAETRRIIDGIANEHASDVARSKGVNSMRAPDEFSPIVLYPPPAPDVP